MGRMGGAESVKLAAGKCLYLCRTRIRDSLRRVEGPMEGQRTAAADVVAMQLSVHLRGPLHRQGWFLGRGGCYNWLLGHVFLHCFFFCSCCASQ